MRVSYSVKLQFSCYWYNKKNQYVGMKEIKIISRWFLVKLLNIGTDQPLRF